MKITDLLKPEGIKVGATAASQMDAIDHASGNINDAEGYKKGILAREAEFSTAVGDGIAIPHAKVAAVKQPGLAAMTVPGGVDWKAPDGEPADLMFMIAAPRARQTRTSRCWPSSLRCSCTQTSPTLCVAPRTLPSS